MANEKRETITMEDLRNSDGLEYLDLIITVITDLTHDIEYIEYGLDVNKYSERVKDFYQKTLDQYYNERSRLLAELGSEFLMCKLDDDVRKYINDRLEECSE